MNTTVGPGQTWPLASDHLAHGGVIVKRLLPHNASACRSGDFAAVVRSKSSHSSAQGNVRLATHRSHAAGQERSFGWARSLVRAWSPGRGGGALCGANVPRTWPGRPVLLLDFAPQSAPPPRPPAWFARHRRVPSLLAAEDGRLPPQRNKGGGRAVQASAGGHSLRGATGRPRPARGRPATHSASPWPSPSPSAIATPWLRSKASGLGMEQRLDSPRTTASNAMGDRCAGRLP
jgi:hypothetical protein